MAERRAIVLDKPGHVAIMTLPMPVVRSINVLVKATAVAVHPIDPPSIDYYGAPGTIPGNDFAGIVEEVGSAVTLDIKPGDRVAGFVHGCKTDSLDVVSQLFSGKEPSAAMSHEIGAFTDHVLAHGDFLFKIPDGMSDVEACTYGASITVAGMALYMILGLRQPNDPSPRPVPLFIHGGATASGATAIQLAKLSGLRVITTCSPGNFDYVRELGADAVYDYHDPDCARKIRRDHPMIEHAYECVAADGAWATVEGIFSLSGGRAVVNVLRETPKRADVTVTHAASYACFGQRFDLGPVQLPDMPQCYEFSKAWWKQAAQLIQAGKLKPHRQLVRDGGLEGVVPGLDEVRAEKIRGHKLVYRM